MTRATMRKSLSGLLMLLLLTVMSSLATTAAHAQANERFNDKVYLHNGDRLTGNIKVLDRGKLRIKTLTMDTVYVNWVDVEAIESAKYLRISKTDGTFRNGRLRKSEASGSMTVQTSQGQLEIPALEIASIQPIRENESIWQRLEGSASAGINYTKASDILLVNVASDIRLRDEKYEIGFGFNWNETQRTENNNSSRADLSGDYTRFLGERWFWKASAGFERNQELGIDLRSIASGTAGRYFLQTPTMRFEVNGGLAISQERRTDNTNQESVEGLIRSSFDLFKLSIPVTRLSANVSIFPGITESNRLRINSDISLRNELWRDVFWDLTFYSNYDNQPVEGADETDYGVITSIGATF